MWLKNHSLTILISFCSDDLTYDPSWERFICNVPNKMMVCQGDSGGPLLLKINNKAKIIGIVLSGYDSKGVCEIPNCGCKNIQTKWTYLWPHKEWILQNSKVDFEDCSLPLTQKMKKKPGLPFISFHFINNFGQSNFDITTNICRIILFIMSIFLIHSNIL